MSVVNKFMNFFGLQEEEEVVEREQVNSRVDEPEQEVETPSFDKRRNQKGNNVVSIHSQKKCKGRSVRAA